MSEKRQWVIRISQSDESEQFPAKGAPATFKTWQNAFEFAEHLGVKNDPHQTLHADQAVTLSNSTQNINLIKAHYLENAVPLHSIFTRHSEERQFVIIKCSLEDLYGLGEKASDEMIIRSIITENDAYDLDMLIESGQLMLNDVPLPSEIDPNTTELILLCELIHSPSAF